jgi:hypothetical protein
VTGRALGIALILWPFASALLLGLHRAGRALHTRYRRSSTVTFHYTDPDGHRLDVEPDTDLDGAEVVTLWARGDFASVPVRIPVDRIEDLIAGLRDTARQTATGDAP